MQSSRGHAGDKCRNICERIVAVGKKELERIEEGRKEGRERHSCGQSEARERRVSNKRLSFRIRARLLLSAARLSICAVMSRTYYA